MSILEQVLEQYSCYNTSRYLARYLYLKNIARVFAKPAEYCGKRVVQWQSQGIERRHALVFSVGYVFSGVKMRLDFAF